MVKPTSKQIIRRYNKLIEDVATKDFYKIDLTNRVNCYTCSVCHHITKTKDVDPGVTPMFFPCEKCARTARSSFYRDIAPHLKPTIEWYRPTLAEVLTKRENAALLDHIFNGGLDSRPVKI